MQIKTHTTPINLNLRYDCIYYFPSRTDNRLNTKMSEAVDGWSCNFYPEMILLINYPEIKFLYVPEEDLSKLNETASGNDEDGEYARLLMQEICGNEDGGVLVARLYSKNSGDDVELFVSSDLHSERDSANRILDDFALELAKENFERITGRSYSSYKAYKELMEAEYRTSGGGGSSIDFITTYGSRTYQETASFEQNVEEQLREKASLLATMSKNSPVEDIKAYLMSLIVEIEDGTKLLKRCKLVVQYDTNTLNQEIFVVKDKDEDIGIRCEFGRGLLERAFYIFFLRHPEGVSVAGLSKHRDELLKIYEKFSLSADKEEMKESIEKMSSKDNINSFCSYVRRTFKVLFGSAIYSDYCVNVDRSSGKYSISLDRKYVDLGDFDW